jgi:N-acetylmuramic acid 6-phosphate etherase
MNMGRRTIESLNPRSKGIDDKPIEEVLRIMNSEDEKIPGVVEGQIPRIAEAVEAVVAAFRGGGRVFLVGAGTSGRIGVMEAAEIPPTFGLPQERIQAVMAGGPEAVFSSIEGAEDDEGAGGAALAKRNISAGDVLVALTASGGTPFVLGALGRAREAGAKTVAVTCNPGAEASELADVVIVLEVGPELVAGSTRLKAGTAQKMAINMITTAAMVRLGLVYDGYMVGVQPTNLKLMRRAEGIVSEIAGVGGAEAGEALREAGGDVRAAVLIASGLTREEAEEALHRSSGSLRRALEGLRGKD